MIYLIRHDYVDPRYENKMLGRLDVNIKELRYRMKRPVIENAIVICSPLKRTQQTASLLGFEHFKTEPRITEFDLGEYAGLPLNLKLKMIVNGIYKSPDSTDHGGESFSAFKDRVFDFFEEILKISKMTPRPIVVITHSGVIRLILSQYLQAYPQTFEPEHLERFSIDPRSFDVTSKRMLKVKAVKASRHHHAISYGLPRTDISMLS